MKKTQMGKRELDRLRESECRFRALFENLNVVALVIDPSDGRLLDANGAAVEYYGWPRERLLSMRIWEINTLPPDEILRRMDQVKNRKMASFLLQHRRADGSARDVEVHSGPIPYEGGTALCSIVHDITERKEAEEALRLSEERFRTAFQTSPDAVVITRLEDGMCVSTNKGFTEITGYTEQETIGRTMVEMNIWGDPEERRKLVEAIRSRGEVQNLEASFRTKRGKNVYGLVSASAIAIGGVPHILSVTRDITERKLAEDALRESEEKFSRIFTKAPLLITLSEVETGRLLEVNEKFLEISCFGRDEVVGRTVTEIGWNSEEQRSRMHRVLRSRGRVTGMELSLRRKDGREVICLYNGELITVGGKERLLSISQDITERKRQEQALQKSEKMLQTIIDAEPECVKLLDANANLILMNRAGLDMLQVDSLEQVKGKCVCPLVTSEYREAFLDLTRRIFQGESGILLFEMVGTKGRHVWLETHAVPLRNEKNEITALLGVTRDVTERKRAEEELREKEEKYRVLFESANDGIFIQDETGFTDCNQKGAEMYGLTKEEIIGHSPSEFAPERQPDGRLSSEVAGEKIRAALNGAPQVFTWQPLRADGSLFDVEITLSRLELGGRTCLQAIVRDISVRKRLEQELLKTQKLESVGTLAGGIAHDFNNLLQGVFGYISMAKLTLDQRERSLAMLEQAEKALHQSVNLTTQLLTFSKGGKPVKKRILLGPVIENGVRFALSGSQLSYRIDLDPDLQTVEADEGQIGQVIHNIVLNGDQAMPLGGRIEIEARNVPAFSTELPPGAADTAHVRISIRDGGTGIPAEYLPRIFDPYFTTKEKGSGLGLATSYSIVRNHGGMITVSSEPGKGSTFTVFLPASGPAPEALSCQEVPTGPLGGRILVMDDEELVRNVAEDLIRVLGHEVLCTADGAAAVDAYRHAKEAGRPYDIVILDLTVRGGIGGQETLQRLQEIDPAVRAVVSSGYSDDEVVSDFRKYGFSGFLKKPYDLTALRETLSLLMM